MLYISTRNKADSYTAHRVFCENTPSDGGMFVPFQLQPFQPSELEALADGTFHNAVAQILNLFYPAKLTGWEIELCAGRNIAVCRKMTHKLIIAETWRNPEGTYACFEKAVYTKLTGRRPAKIPLWAKITIRTAVLFGVYTQAYKAGTKSFDIVTLAEDSVSYLAAFYARLLGLPIKTILIGCDDSGGLWELVHKGTVATTALEDTGPEALIYTLYGPQESQRFVTAANSRKGYALDPEQQPLHQQGFFAAVVGSARLNSVISSVFRTNGYIFTPEAARMHGTLMDYRARTGESRDTLLFVDRNPLSASERIQDATGLTLEQLSRQISPVKE